MLMAREINQSVAVFSAVIDVVWRQGLVRIILEALREHFDAGFEGCQGLLFKVANGYGNDLLGGVWKDFMTEKDKRMTSSVNLCQYALVILTGPWLFVL